MFGVVLCGFGVLSVFFQQIETAKRGQLSLVVHFDFLLLP